MNEQQKQTVLAVIEQYKMAHVDGLDEREQRQTDWTLVSIEDLKEWVENQ
jgi:hypothetical protein